MDALTAIEKRRTCRHYLTKEVPYEILLSILAAGHGAPSAGNLQERSFTIIIDPQKREEIATLSRDQGWMGSAPVHIVVCIEPKGSKEFYGDKGVEYARAGAYAAIQNILLAATAQGLGSAWVAIFDKEGINSAVGINGAEPVAVITLGYPASTTPVPPQKDLDEVVFIHKYSKKKKHLIHGSRDYYQYIDEVLKRGKEFLSK